MDFFESVAEKIAAGTERGKELGRKVLRQAGTAAQTMRSRATATAQAAKDRAVQAARAAQVRTMDAARAARHKAEEVARAAQSRAREMGRAAQAKVEETARAVQTKATETARAAQAKLEETARAARAKATEIGQAARTKVQDTARAVDDGIEQAKAKTKEGVAVAKKKAGEVIDWGHDKIKQAYNYGIGELADGGVDLLTKSSAIEQCLANALRDKNRVKHIQDGQYMGNNCPNSSEEIPTTGRLPEGCGGSGGKLPKIIYTNGINTPPDAACTTMRQIANERCAEVIGVYNASYGTIEDGLDAKDSIDRKGRQPAAKSQAKLMQQMLKARPPEKVTLYAHSEGGLITQEGLAQTREKLQQEKYDALLAKGMGKADAKEESKIYARGTMLRNVDVYSFGTAERNWPNAANLHQFTNTSDPVPKVINRVQSNHGGSLESAYVEERHVFTKPSWGPIDPHSMDKTYLPELNRVKPVPKKANGKCC